MDFEVVLYGLSGCFAPTPALGDGPRGHRHPERSAPRGDGAGQQDRPPRGARRATARDRKK